MTKTDWPNSPVPAASVLRSRILAMLEPDDFMPEEFISIKDLRDCLQDQLQVNLRPHTEALNDFICDVKTKRAVKAALADAAAANAARTREVAKREQAVAERLRAYERLFERETRVAEGERRLALQERQLHERARQLDERQPRRRSREEGDNHLTTAEGGASSSPREWSDGTLARVSVATPDGAFYVRLNTWISVDALKATLEYIVGIPKADQRIEVGGSCLDDATAVLRYCGVVEYATVHLTYPAAPAPRNSFSIQIKELDRPSFQIKVASRTRIEHVKFLIWLKRGIPPQQQRLIFTAKQLEPGRTLADHGIFAPDAVVHLVVNDSPAQLKSDRGRLPFEALRSQLPEVTTTRNA